jgi:putative ATP-dependent endonuclease of OLD family
LRAAKQVEKSGPMARIRKIEIRHFRAIQEFAWLPSAGVNCLIGPGDSGKSSILDAIDFCLGARRNVQFSDADFHALDVETPICISVTLGELDDALKNLDAYGMYVRSFDAASGEIGEEPEADKETVLTVNLTVAGDLEPSWTLVSPRAQTQGLTRNLSWSDRVRLAPTRIGVMADYHLGWRRGSVLNQLSEERADASAALVKAARDARAAFGDQAKDQLRETLTIVTETARELGIRVGDPAKALLDAHTVSFSGGTISLHDEDGIPLRGLGIGSARLLTAGLQRKAADRASMILIDELEHGLEPHRIIRLLGSLGAKEGAPPLQVFMTTHSPVALRELSGSQLHVVRPTADRHDARLVGIADDVQSTIRLYPDAFLAPSVIVCEGATEVGLVRGLDQFRSAAGANSISALGVALVDSGGGEPDRPLKRAGAFQALGYRTALVRDDDQRPAPTVEQPFKDGGGTVVAWRDGRSLEDELFLSLTAETVAGLVGRATDLHGDPQVDAHIRSASQNARDLAAIRVELASGVISAESRAILARSAKTRKSGWFKSVTWMEDAARDIIGPDLANAEAGFRALIDEIFAWAGDG